MDILAKIKGIKYNPLLCRDLEVFDSKNLEKALSSCASFILKISKENQVAISRWLSAKRTRSYPYARVYDTLSFSGKKITIIPVVKDEGKKGDRDFLQWDTISLMSLLGVYVIIAYYTDAGPSKREKYKTSKITDQRFDIQYIKQEIEKLLSYQSDALHWNLSQIDKIGIIGQKALKAYDKISKKFGIEMHSKESVEKRVEQLLKHKDVFMNLSRKLDKRAQVRESITIQPKEKLVGDKATITIKNYLGGYYYFTVDEYKIEEKRVYLVEAKHTKKGKFPSDNDIKDGLLKMILFTNLENIKIDGENYNPVAVLKLTIGKHFDIRNMNDLQKKNLSLLHREAKQNNFEIRIL